MKLYIRGLLSRAAGEGWGGGERSEELMSKTR